jgi:hypothetical protein
MSSSFHVPMISPPKVGYSAFLRFSMTKGFFPSMYSSVEFQWANPTSEEPLSATISNEGKQMSIVWGI